MRPDARRRWRCAKARELGMSQPLSTIARDLLNDLLAFRQAANDTSKTDDERNTARVRYGRCWDRLTSRSVRRTRGRSRSR